MKALLPRNDFAAAAVGVSLAALTAAGLPALGYLWFPLQIVLPFFACILAKRRTLIAALIPTTVLNVWLVFVQAPKSGYWAGWQHEWEVAAFVFGFGATASLIVSGAVIWWRRQPEQS